MNSGAQLGSSLRVSHVAFSSIPKIWRTWRAIFNSAPRLRDQSLAQLVRVRVNLDSAFETKCRRGPKIGAVGGIVPESLHGDQPATH